MGNGLRVLTAATGTLPQAAIRLIVPAGSARDPEAFPGTAALAGALLTEGTLGLSARELNQRLDSLGASLSVQVGHDFAEVDLYLLSETMVAGFDLLADVVLHPAFPADEVERARAETLDAFEARADEPANVADDRTSVEIFGAHPYARLTTGTPEGVAAVPREALEEFHATHYRPRGSVLLVAGSFDEALLRHLVEDRFGGWEGEAPLLTLPPTPARPAAAGSLVRLPWPDAAQGEIRVAGAGLRRADPEWVPATVANYLLGGSTITGRLGANLREEKGWTYGVRSGFAAALQPAGWAIETAVEAEVVDAALAEIAGELERFLAGPVPEEELARARHSLILSLPRAFETPGRVVSRLGTVEAFGLPSDYWETYPARIREVTAEEVLRIARERFDPAGLVRVVVGGGADE
jgi:zinc protease